MISSVDEAMERSRRHRLRGQHLEHFSALAMQALISLGCSREMNNAEAMQIACNSVKIAEMLIEELSRRSGK